MTREDLIDIIRNDLRKQADSDNIEIQPSDTPDTFIVKGTLDLHQIAVAILYARRHHNG